jgi:hypothetical protein
MQKLTYTLPELQKLKAEGQNTLKSLEKARIAVRNATSKIDTMIRESDARQSNWKFHVDKALVKDIKGVAVAFMDDKAQDESIKWKEVVLATIRTHNMPMNSQLVCGKFLQTMPYFKKDRRFVIKNVSAALSVLYSDGKLFRHPFKKRNDYLYGLIDFYDEHGTLKQEYYSKFKQEYEDN